MSDFDDLKKRNAAMQTAVDEMLADYRKVRDEVGSAQERTQQVSGSATSKNGAVTVTVGPQGNLADISFRQDVFRVAGGPDQLAKAIMEAAHRAQEEANEEMEDVMSDLLPPGVSYQDVAKGDIDPMKFLQRGDSDTQR